MKMITRLLAIAIMFASCGSPTDEPINKAGSVQINPTELTLDFEGQETYVTVTADTDWGSTVADPSWCSVYPTGGIKGETKVKITVKKNVLTEDRVNTIIFRTASSTTQMIVTQETSSTGEAMFVPEGYKLFWSDEFDGAKLNTDWWTCETGRGSNGWGNAELQYYTDRPENVDVQDGRLVITARKESYQGATATSARLITLGKVYFKYGYVTASIKLPKTANGLWPAFWMMGNDFKSKGWPNCGETDILEMGHQNGIRKGTQEKFLNGACHWGAPGHQYYSYDFTNSYSVQDGQFHTFTCIWDEDQIAMYIDLDTRPDAKPYFKMALKDFGDNEFRKDNFILLNLAVGGNFPGIWDIDQITALNDGPARMEVDYVRVFQKK
ncbi:MAG: family 16 glycosylhydrolase [Bacteroidales bacterium]|nr:family 16 glycosylhydrolase [Bacteroidales bacterium]MBO5979318.1 family 16 glycosylhydrolase [Bacteroidales bacterium]